MIALIGSNGYIGSAFARELDQRKLEWVGLRRTQALQSIHLGNFSIVINCAAFIPPESVSICDQRQYETILGNVILPSDLSEACEKRGIVMAHISTGCLWDDGKIHTEEDIPQRGFSGHCGFYIGTKLMAETMVSKNPKHYIWRIRLPFDEFDNNRNYLSKLVRFNEVWDHENSMCHRADIPKACLDLVSLNAPFGTYHVMNTGSMRAEKIVEKLMAAGIRKTAPKIVSGPQSGGITSNAKMLKVGVTIRNVEDALDESIRLWRPDV